MIINVVGTPAPQGKRTSRGTFVRMHGLAIERNPIYVAWKSIRRRCCDSTALDYRHYGGRGIVLYCEWVNAPERFVDYVEAVLGHRPSARHSLDRINNDGNYEPGNLRWATRVEQQRNKRNNHLVTHEGVTKTVQEWAEITGIKQCTIRWRSAVGMPSKDILSAADRRFT